MMTDVALTLGRDMLSYEIICTFCKTDGAEGATVYGFRAELIETADCVEFKDISSDKKDVERLINMLQGEEVSLVHLYDIVEDYIVQL